LETPIYNACIIGDINVVKCLVEHGADINAINPKFETPLHKACLNGNENIVKYLVEHGVDINKETREEKEIRHYIKHA